MSEKLEQLAAISAAIAEYESQESQSQQIPDRAQNEWSAWRSFARGQAVLGRLDWRKRIGRKP